MVVAVAVQPDFSALVAADREAALAYEEVLAELYAKELRKMARDAAAMFAKHAWAGMSITASADWHLPHPDEILDVEKAAARLGKTTEGLREEIARAAMGGTLAAYGVRFDIANPLLKGVLAQLGTHITSIVESERAEIMGVLQKAYDEGLSIREATRELTKTSAVSSSVRGSMIARTELAAATNGGSLTAAKLVVDASPPGAAMMKFWIATEDDRTRDSHLSAAADYAEDSPIPISEPFIVGSDEMQHPGDPDGSPEEVINCRCAVGYVQPAQTPSLGGFGGLGGEGGGMAAPAEGFGGEAEAGFAPLATGEAADIRLLSADERAAYNEYQIDSDPINNYLRAGGKGKARLDKSIAALDRAATRVEVPRGGQLVHRGFESPEQIKKLLGVRNLDEAAGKRFSDEGFLSTTPDVEFAQDYAGEFDGGTVFNLDLPEGMRVGWYRGGMQELGGEQEILLPRGTQIVIDDYRPPLFDEVDGELIQPGSLDAHVAPEVGQEAFVPTAARGEVTLSEPIMKLSDDMVRTQWADVAARDRAQSIINEANLDVERVLSYRAPDGSLRGVATTTDRATHIRVEVAGADREAEQELIGRAARMAKETGGGKELWIEGATDAQTALVRDLVRNKYQKVVGLKEQGGYLKLNRTGIDNTIAKFEEKGPPVAPPVEPPTVAPPPPVALEPESVARTIGGLIQRAPGLERATTVYRGLDHHLPDLGPGGVVPRTEMETFVSTTTERAIATDYAGGNDMLAITMPEGTQGAWMPKLAEGRNAAVEREYVLAPDAGMLVVTGSEPLAEGGTLYHVELRKAFSDRVAGAPLAGREAEAMLDRQFEGFPTVEERGAATYYSGIEGHTLVNEAVRRDSSLVRAPIAPPPPVAPPPPPPPVEPPPVAPIGGQPVVWENLKVGDDLVTRHGEVEFRNRITKIEDDRIQVTRMTSRAGTGEHVTVGQTVWYKRNSPFFKQEGLRHEPATPIAPAPPVEPPAGRIGKTSDEYTLIDLNDQIYNEARWADTDALTRARRLVDKADVETQRVVSYHDADGRLAGIGLQTEELLDVRLEVAGADEAADQQLIAHAAEAAARADKELWIVPANDAQTALIRRLLRNKYGKTVSVTERAGRLVVNKKGVRSILERLRPGQPPPVGPPPVVKKPAAPPPEPPVMAEAGTAEGGAATTYARLTKMQPGSMYQIRAGYKIQDGYTGYRASFLTTDGKRISTMVEARSEYEARQKLDQLASYVDHLPLKMQQDIKRIGCYVGRSPSDAEAAIRYNMPGFTSAATAWQGAGDIAFWGGRISETTLYHEAGHIVGADGGIGTASARWGKLAGKVPERWSMYTSGGPRGGFAQWASAAVKDLKAQQKLGFDNFYDSVGHRALQTYQTRSAAISRYGETFISEDWADSVMAFLHDQRYGSVGKITFRKPNGLLDIRQVRFADIYPNRARIIARALGYPDPTLTASALRVHRVGVVPRNHGVRVVILDDLEDLVGYGVADDDGVGAAVRRRAVDSVFSGRHDRKDTPPTFPLANGGTCKRVVRRRRPVVE